MVYMVMSGAASDDCTALIRDNYIQKTLQAFEEEEEEIDDTTYNENILKYLDDMCGWIPDPSVQYRRQPREKTSQKGTGRHGKPDWGSLSRRTGRHENSPQITYYEFKHYSNLRKYIEQYRRFHTCGGPLEKLSQSAYGRTKTIYYTNESAPEAPTSTERRPSDSGPGSQHLPDAPKGGLVRPHEEPPSSAPRYHAMTDAALRKRSVSSHNLGNYTNNGWSNVQSPGVAICGEPPPQKTTNSNKDTPMQWTINEHGLTIYQNKSPTVFQQRDARPIPGSPLPMTGYGPGAHHQGSYNQLPFFTPSQHAAGLQPKRKQLTTPPNMPTNLPVTSGFSIDRTIGGVSSGLTRRYWASSDRVSCIPDQQHFVWTAGSRNSSTGATPDQGSSFKDFYSQLVHAAVNLQLTNNANPGCTVQDDNHKIQNKLNLSPQRQIKTCDIRTQNSSRKSHHSFDSKSTCSSHGSSASSKRRRKQRKLPLEKDNVKGQHRSSPQQNGQARSYASSASVTSTRTPLNPTTHHVLTLHAPPKTAPSSSEKISRFSSEDAHRGDLESKKTYRVSMKNGMEVEPDRRVAVCEATWY